MPLIKNEIPILEYDTDKNAIFMPKKATFPSKAVMLFMEKEIEEYAATHDCEIVWKLECVTKTFPFYKTVHNGAEMIVCQAPLGGAGAVEIMEQLIAGGVKEIIAAGCCGALVEDTEGDFFIPTAALRQEGTSYHYLPPAREVELAETAIEAIETALQKRNFRFRRCKTWSTDGLHRETKEMVSYRKEEGYSVVEMECASLAACAKMRKITFGQLLFTADSLVNVEEHNTRNWGEETFSVAMELAMDSVAEIME